MGCDDWPADADAGGRPPNLKPSRNVRWPGPGDASGMGTPSCEGGGVPKSSSCVPSSAMLVAGSDPGRGKKMDRLREWMRECLRDGAPLSAEPFSTGEVGGWRSGAVKEDDILCGGGMASCWGGKDDESGEGVIGENGPDIERVRECACKLGDGSERDWRIAGGWCRPFARP